MSRKLHARRIEGIDKNVWVEFTQLAADYKAVNLGQGFPDFSPPSFIQEAFCKALSGGFSMHQYTRAFVRNQKYKSFPRFQFAVLVNDQLPLQNVIST